MVLTNPTAQEEREFKRLQEQGMLPSEALQKLETERKLGIISPEPSSTYNLKENWWFYLGAGLIGVTILYIYIKGNQTTVAPKASYNSPNLQLNNESKISELEKELEIIKIKNELNNIKQHVPSDEYQKQLKLNEEEIDKLKKEIQLTDERIKQSPRKTLNSNIKNSSAITFKML